MKGVRICAALLFVAPMVTGCVQYWVRPNTGLQQTASDLYECRKTGSQAGMIYTGLELESPCMASKGYALSNTPPKAP